MEFSIPTGFKMSLAAVKTEDPQAYLDGIFEKARTRQLSLQELFQIAEGLKGFGHVQKAADLYKIWIAYNADNPLLHMVYFNYSVALRQLDDQAGAINALRACVKIDPLFGPAHINLGRTLEDNGHLSQAIALWREFVDATSSITPDRLTHRLLTLQHIGRVFENAELLKEAEDALKQAIELRPDKFESGQHWLALRQRQCKWPVLLPSDHVTARQLLDAMSPMALAAFADDPMFQLAKACKYNKSFVGRPDTKAFVRPSPRKVIGKGRRLRVGYLSSDLRDHAVGFALSEVLELHDKNQVEIFGYYCGEARRNDLTQERIRAAIDHWRDIANLTDEQAALKIVDDKIDVLIDVNGNTKHARTRIFAYRPAPVIVNWCGYPGTMGSPYHQYMITDDVIVPPGNEIYYSEKVLRIPCNQPVDRKRHIARPGPTRAEVGLPEDKFIFASFNGMQKLTANCFGRWMDILTAVPDSVLWQLTGNDDTNERLRAAAAQRGIEPERLIFAQKAANPQHLARIALADLFLDTLPYGAHSTAADALTMGLPIVTLPGRSFASRFCASVVSAAGLADLICATPEDYVQRAVELARNRSKLATYREILQKNRDTSVLRDIPALVRQLEKLFWEMQADAEDGRLPVPDLANLDIYYEIGAELDLENIDSLDERAYRQLYAEKLAEWHRHAAIRPDCRFWPDSVPEKPARLLLAGE